MRIRGNASNGYNESTSSHILLLTKNISVSLTLVNNLMWLFEKQVPRKKPEQVFKCYTVEHEDKDTFFNSLTSSKTLGSVQKMTATLQKSPLQPSFPCKLLPGIGRKVLSRFQEATVEQVMMSYTSDVQRGWENPQKRETFWGVHTCR